MPRWIDARRVTFKYGLGAEFIDVLKALHKLGLDSTTPVRGAAASRSRRVTSSPRCCPNPAGLGELMSGKTCAGLWVSGTGTDGRPRQVYLYHVVDNAWSMRGVRGSGGGLADRGQPGRRPRAAGRPGAWRGSGVLGPEAFDAVPFLDLLTAYGSPWGMREGG